MKKLSYFLMVGLAFTALQVATVEALDDPNMPPAGMSGGQCDSNPACDPSDPAANCCAGMCDPNPACVMDDPNAIPCCGPMDGPPPGEHHDDGKEEHHDDGNHDDGKEEHHDGPDCAALPNPDEVAACWDAKKGEHNEHDCSEIPEPEGKALCEKAKERGTPPTAEECAQMPTEEGRKNCLEHTGDHPPGQHPEIDTSHCDQFEGAPKAACIAAAESGPPGGDTCADRETAALVAACVREKQSHPAP